MKRMILVVLILFSLCSVADARWYNILLYCYGRQSVCEDESCEHWKDEIPDLGIGNVIRDHVLIAKQGARRFYHCLVEKSEDNSKQFHTVKTYIDDYNIGKAIQDQILYWHGATEIEAYMALWQDRNTDPFIELIAKSVLKYPVETTCDGNPCTIIVSVKEAEDTYGETIVPSKILVPHKFFGL